MPAEGSPPDVPPAAFGRYRVLHHIGAGSLGPVFHGEDPATGHAVAITLLHLGLTPDRAERIAGGLSQLRDTLPAHEAIAPVVDAGLQNGEPFYVTPLVTGDSLDVALERYGPAAIVDAVARLRLLANALDRAAQAGIWHGALQPQDISVSAEDTVLRGLGIVTVLEREGVPLPARTQYTAPEAADGHATSAAADQFALAAIAHEWLFGRRHDDVIDLPSLPGVSAERLESAFTGALAPQPGDRFQTSGAFVAALSASVRDAPTEPRVDPTRLEPPPVQPMIVEPEPNERAFTDLELDAQAPVDTPAAPVMWQGAFAAEPVPEESGGYSTGALAATLVFGIALGMAAATWLSSRTADDAPGEEFTDATVPAAEPRRPRIEEPPVVPAVRQATVERPGALLVRSTPAGARVLVDGVERGETPLTLRDLELGTHSVSIVRAGSAPVERSVTLTADRPSRSLEELLTLRTPPSRSPGRLGTAGVKGADAGATAPGTGSLSIASRPAGASVTIDGRPAGTTPLIVPALSAGSHTVRLDRPGYRPWTTTVQISEASRARVAASLVGGQAQE